MEREVAEKEFAHILSTFPLVPRETRDAALAGFRRMGRRCRSRPPVDKSTGSHIRASHRIASFRFVSFRYVMFYLFRRMLAGTLMCRGGHSHCTFQDSFILRAENRA